MHQCCVAAWRRCCNIANGCCLVLALPLTIPLILLTIDVGEFFSFSTWVCLAYGAFFGGLFSIYEFRHRKYGKFTMAGKAGADKTWDDFLNGAQHRHTLAAAARDARNSHGSHCFRHAQNNTASCRVSKPEQHS